MERKTTAQKVFFTILDVILIIGGIASVLTIDRGMWWKTIVEYYGSEIAEMESGPYVPSYDASGSGATLPGIPNTGDAEEAPCLAWEDWFSQEWDDNYRMSAYLQAANAQQSFLGAGEPGRNCN